nr:RNA-directed DNA polymerase, eukaryota, reverse transcriptase zinc-binding domain protein [Tanacetum cinerariifolium]
MVACTGCEASSFPFSYLGLPICSNMSRIANWQILIDRFKARLSGWKANFLSIGGRLTFIKYVLGSLGYLAWNLENNKDCFILHSATVVPRTTTASFFTPPPSLRRR